METRLETITLPEMQEQWPKTDDGALCARLLQRYAFSRLVETAADATGLPERSGAEAGAHKTLAMMAKDFGTLSIPRAEKAPLKMQSLNRHREPAPHPIP